MKHSDHSNRYNPKSFKSSKQSKFHGTKRNRNTTKMQYTKTFILSLKEHNREKPKKLLYINVPKFYPKKQNSNNSRHQHHNNNRPHSKKKKNQNEDRNWDHMEMIRSFQISEDSFTKRSKVEDMEDEEIFLNEFRNLFNKVSEETFDGIRQEISDIPCDNLNLNDAKFLQKTSKILIEKAVIDHKFIDLYVTLMMDIYNKLFHNSTDFLDQVILYCTLYFYPADSNEMTLKEIRKFKYIGCLNFMTHTILVESLDEDIRHQFDTLFKRVTNDFIDGVKKSNILQIELMCNFLESAVDAKHDEDEEHEERLPWINAQVQILNDTFEEQRSHLKPRIRFMIEDCLSAVRPHTHQKK